MPLLTREDWRVLEECSADLSLDACLARLQLEYFLSDLRAITGEPTRDRSGWAVVYLGDYPLPL